MSDKHRRKSLSIFRQSAPTSTPADSNGPPHEKHTSIKKKNRPPSINTSTPIPEGSPNRPPPPNSAVSEHFEHSGSPKIRPRALQKSNRTSVFGSLRSLRSFEDEEKLIKTDSKDSFTYDGEELLNIQGLFGKSVLHHGEVQTSGGVFRKRTQYLVLTETHLIRFRSQAKAAEVFPSVPPALGRPNTTRQSTASTGSSHDLPISAYSEITFGIALDKIVAVYKLDDGRPYFTIEVSHLDDQSKRSSSMQMQLNEPREADMWLNAIQTAASKSRLKHGFTLTTSSIEHVARVVERDQDYDPDHFHVYPVVQRASHKTAGRSSSDDLSKLNSTICYLVVGANKIHLVPFPKSSGRSSSTSLNDLETPASFGIMTLTSVSLQGGEDTFQLVFRAPFRSSFAMHLASRDAGEIALWIRFTAEYLRPEWLRQPFIFDVPPELDDQMDSPNIPTDEHKCIDRTLTAYCAAYDVDTSKIRYSIDYACEDAPCFRLLPSAGQPYSAMELLAIMRSLRYNESFTSISFADIILNALRFLYDPYGPDVDSMSTRSGMPIKIPNHQDLPVLLQETRALALKSKRLRRLDFTNCLTRRAMASGDVDLSCGIPEALVPLCKKSFTNVDWIILNGIKLADSDLDYLVDAASERICHLRAMEIGDSGLSVHDMDVLLSTLAIHENTMEVIDISGAQGRFSPELFQRQISYFGHIRRLNLTRVQKTAGTEPLIPPEVLLTWRLEALYLSQTVLNEQTVDSISAYLLSRKSDTLRELRLDQCGISGKDLAIFFQSMTREPGTPRQLHLSASENRLKQGYTLLFKSIAQNHGPTHFTARMIEFEKEHHFYELVLALTKNTTLKALDISKASLPYDATDETCAALKTMFAQNSSLEELDISGEQAHLDSARFGIGLNLALTGLKENKSLRVLKIEHQNLGLQGANTLAEVLEENDTLEAIYCENNDINLQSFTILVDALAKNKTLLYMPTLDRDRELSLEKVRREIQGTGQMDGDLSPSKGGSIKRTLTGAISSRSLRHAARNGSITTSSSNYTDQDINTVLFALDQKWNFQATRLERYLQRNYHLANGLPWDDDKDMTLPERPTTTESLSRLLEKVRLGRTPTKEKEVDLGLFDFERSPTSGKSLIPPPSFSPEA